MVKKYNVGTGSVSRTWQARDKIEKAVLENPTDTRRRIFRQGDNEVINKAVWRFFCEQRAYGAPLSGPLLQEFARDVARELGILDFKASNGWLGAFKGRHNTGNAVLAGESRDVDCSTMEVWLERLPQLLASHSPVDIFNVDESGLFWRGLPTRSLVAKGDCCKGGKLSKERLTILFGCSMLGEKLPLLVVGKSAKPRCFKNFDISALGIT